MMNLSPTLIRSIQEQNPGITHDGAIGILTQWYDWLAENRLIECPKCLRTYPREQGYNC